MYGILTQVQWEINAELSCKFDLSRVGFRPWALRTASLLTTTQIIWNDKRPRPRNKPLQLAPCNYTPIRGCRAVWLLRSTLQFGFHLWSIQTRLFIHEAILVEIVVKYVTSARNVGASSLRWGMKMCFVFVHFSSAIYYTRYVLLMRIL
jgi:hypothetical protein